MGREETARHYTLAKPAISPAQFLVLVLPGLLDSGVSPAVDELGRYTWRVVEHTRKHNLVDRRGIARGVSTAETYFGVGRMRGIGSAHRTVISFAGLDNHCIMQR